MLVRPSEATCATDSRSLRSRPSVATNPIVNVFIARDGVEIGEFACEDIANLVRSGEILPSDDYWHEGMEAWGIIDDLLKVRTCSADGETAAPPVNLGDQPGDPIPEPVPQPKNWRLIGAVALGAPLALIALAVLLIKPDAPAPEGSRTASLGDAAPSPPFLSGLDLRDKAAADLRQRIERLPTRAAPPLNTFYYDLAVNMRKMVSPTTPWSAIITGRENIIDPGTQETLAQTEFTLTADYTDGAWVYKAYRATVGNIKESTTTETTHDQKLDTPPTIVGMLGLKVTYYQPKTSISISK